MSLNPSSLLQPDWLGDANATGHVAPKYGGRPIHLVAGETFNEYFGAKVYGFEEAFTPISGVITLTLTYEYEYTPPATAPDAASLRSARSSFRRPRQAAGGAQGTLSPIRSRLPRRCPSRPAAHRADRRIAGARAR